MIENEAYFRKCVADLISKDDPGSQCSNAADHQLADTELRDPRTVIWTEFHAILGRASSLTSEERERRRADIRMRRWGAPEVLTYDRLLYAARREDEALAGRRDR